MFLLKIVVIDAMNNAFVKRLQTREPLSAESAWQLQNASSRTQVIRANRHIVQERDALSASFAMLSGWACCYTLGPNGARRIIRLMMAGDFCEMHADVSVRMDYSVSAITNAEIAFIPALWPGRSLAALPDVQQALYRTRVRDDAIARAWLSRLGRGDSVVAMAHLICELYLRAGGSATGAGEIALPLTQPVLADATAMTSVHANRVLKQLREREGVTLRRGVLNISNFEALAELSDFDATYLTLRQKDG